MASTLGRRGGSALYKYKYIAEGIVISESIEWIAKEWIPVVKMTLGRPFQKELNFIHFVHFRHS